ncbi:MAG: class I SAM-dependent methyltransferase [Alphaproteobacteria bacterium]|jgi:SAM-dependent methyltransferase|nr:class I SAM-dependent methyltransferase [Alphaproteobacteria bacterium]
MTEITVEQQTERLWDYVKGFHAVHLIDTGVKLGLFQSLDEAEAGLTPEALAEAHGLHAPYVRVWCQTACAYHLLDPAADGAFALAPHLEQLLVQMGNPRNLGAYFRGCVDFLGADMSRYPEFFKSGGTYTFQEHGLEFSQTIADTTAGLQAAVARHFLPSVPGVREVLEGGGAVLDMGCGGGNLMLQIAKAFAECRCVGVDVDAHGITLATGAIAEAGLADRVSAEHTDGGEIGHENEFDVCTLFEVLHELPMAVRAQVMANAHRALKPGGTLFILDETYPSVPEDLRRPEYAFSVQTAYNELIWGNVVPTKEDQESLLGEAGFTDLQRGEVGGLFTLLTAKKPG